MFTHPASPRPVCRSPEVVELERTTLGLGAAMTGPMTMCGPDPKCADPHAHRWYCMRGHALDDKPKVPGACPLDVCDRRGANANLPRPSTQPAEGSERA